LTEGVVLPQELGDGLVLRAVESDADADRVIAINSAIHGTGVEPVLRRWLLDGHPALFREGWLFVEDVSSGEVVSTLSLMPVRWRYGDQTLPVAEMGFVATRPAYRGRGLQRSLADHFEHLARDMGYTLAAIEGIPGFYGQFGYEYAVPLIGGTDLAFARVPDDPVPDGYRTRAADLDDVPALQRFYDASIAGLDIAALRGAELWRLHLELSVETDFYGRTTVIERDGAMVGYVRWTDDDWMDPLRILELAVQPGPDARNAILLALQFARERGRAENRDGLRLQLPEDHPAVRVAGYLGGVDTGYYGWQMKVLDLAGFMRAVGSTLEARLAASVLDGYSGTLLFNLYRSRLALRFERGRLAEVDGTHSSRGGDRPGARMRQKQATQLWLGWRGREALEGWYPDFSTRAEARHLLDVLFPRARAYIYTAY
jgi:GNAT superfamily N-acetyltransferase